MKIHLSATKTSYKYTHNTQILFKMVVENIYTTFKYTNIHIYKYAKIYTQTQTGHHQALALRSARLIALVVATQPALIGATDIDELHSLHSTKDNLDVTSLDNTVLKLLHMWQLTYCKTYRRSNDSICFCMNFPFITKRKLASRLASIPSSAITKSLTCS